MNLTLRNVEVGGRSGLDVRIADGRIADIGPRLGPDRQELDGRGGALLPGLVDHHIHLFGLAAQAASVRLDDVATADALAVRMRAALAERPPGAWVRVLGYHETVAGELSRQDLDILAPRHPVRVQHQSGALWVLNSPALAALGEGDDPPGLDRASGRLWRGDPWLRQRVGADPPPLAPIGRRLAAFGITALTDASVTTDHDAASRLAEAARQGDLPHRLTLMSGGDLTPPNDGAFAVGPVKILLDDHSLPNLEDFIARIRRARTWGRAVAVHCVTAAELALTLASFEAAGARAGDRVEHGGMIPQDAIGILKRLGLTVVTQPAFIFERGDRYAKDIPPAEHDDLYRCASLLAAGVPVAASSDAPYASPDPWLGVASAVGRRSAGGQTLGAGESVSPAIALSLYLGDPQAPGGPPRQVAPGTPADLCLLDAPLRAILEAPSAARVRNTLIGGQVVHTAGAE